MSGGGLLEIFEPITSALGIKSSSVDPRLPAPDIPGAVPTRESAQISKENEERKKRTAKRSGRRQNILAGGVRESRGAETLLGG